MNTLYRFWSLFLRDNFNRNMYNEFRKLAVEDAEAGFVDIFHFLRFIDFHFSFRYGIESLFRFYSVGLEKKMRPQLYTDFQQTVIDDVKRGHTTGLDKFLALLKYCKYANLLEVNPFLAKELAKYKKQDEFLTNVRFPPNTTYFVCH